MHDSVAALRVAVEAAEAARPAAAAQAWCAVGDVVVHCAAGELAGEHADALADLLDRVPASVAPDDAALAAARALGAVLRGDAAAARVWLVATRGPALGATGAGAGGAAGVVASLAEALLAEREGRADAMRAAARQAQDLATALDPAVAPAAPAYLDVCALLLGLADILGGELVAGTARLGALRSWRATTRLLEDRADAVRRLAVALSGRPAEARAAALRAAGGRAGHPATDVAGRSADAWAALIQGDLATARALVLGVDADALRRADLVARTGVELAGVLAALVVDGPAVGRRALERLDGGAPATGSVVAHWRAGVAAEVWLAAGDAASALDLVRSAADAGRLSGALAAAQARALADLGRVDEARAAVVEARAATAEDDRTTPVAVTVAQAAVDWAAGDVDAARLTALDAARRASEQGVLLPLLLLPAHLAELLPVRVRDAVRDLRRAGGGPAPERLPLTRRERAVLALLPEQLTVAQMAARLGISLNTVRHHLKAVYRKLEVGSRGEALRRAMALGLLP